MAKLIAAASPGGEDEVPPGSWWSWWMPGEDEGADGGEQAGDGGDGDAGA